MRVCEYQKRSLQESREYFLKQYGLIQAGKWDRINDVTGLVNKYVKKGGRVVEIGCGLGYIAYYLAKDCGYRVVGVDLDQDTVTHGNSIFSELDRGGQPSDIRLQLGSYDILPKENEKADAVIGLEVIEHVNDPTEFLRCISETLKPGGLLFLTTPNASGFRNMFPKHLTNIVRFVESLPPYTGGEEDHINFWDFQTLYRLCNRAGFKLVNYQFTNFYLAFPLMKKLIYIPWMRKLPIIGQYSNNLLFALQKNS